MSRFLRWLLVILFVLTAAALVAPGAFAQGDPAEVPVQLIPLSGPASDSDAEISGLAWWGDTLFLLVENPNLYASGDTAGSFFALDKADILSYLDGDSAGPLEPREIPVISDDIPSMIPGYDGFESVTFVGDTAYLTIEAWRLDGEMRGYLVSGTMDPDAGTLALDLNTRAELLPQTTVLNISYESILAVDDGLVTFYELYGPTLNETPFAYRVSADLQTLAEIPMVPLDYRLTDITALDENDQFWGINYFYPGDTFAATDDDPIAERYGEGPAHAAHNQVERLVAFQYTADGITLADVPPVQLELTDDDARNWEGLVRLDERGFLLVTDEHPDTLLGFVPLPEQ
ncbi:hypothetical protein [Aggregatilinea lenta]|uniref:hypothetical protein n=1 Tax=Aggregatilinea lenta TaxID=913108 RepID=UPI000E5BEFF6|nr:hypothetical protein [Aggregatilinea lenta]